MSKPAMRMRCGRRWILLSADHARGAGKLEAVIYIAFTWRDRWRRVQSVME